MGLFKKVLSTVCAVAMLTTVSSAFIVRAEEVKPTLKITVSYDDETKKTGTAKVSIVDLDKTTDKKDYYFVENIQVGIGISSTDFDTSLYSTSGFVKPINSNVKFNSRLESKAQPKAFSDDTLFFTYADPSIETNLTDSTLVGRTDGIGDIFVEEFKFKLNSDTAQFTPGNVMIVASTYSEDASSIIQMDKWGNMKGCTEMNYDFEVVGQTTPEKPSVPTNTGATADSSAILNVKPSDVGGTGDVWASADGSENAVAGLANFTPSAATSTIEWTISATPVGGEATQYTKAFDLGASIDAAATIGLIVNYNTAEYSSVSIVSGALK